jgi:hypothetical protein
VNTFARNEVDLCLGASARQQKGSSCGCTDGITICRSGDQDIMGDTRRMSERENGTKKMRI